MIDLSTAGSRIALYHRSLIHIYGLYVDAACVYLQSQIRVWEREN